LTHPPNGRTFLRDANRARNTLIVPLCTVFVACSATPARPSGSSRECAPSLRSSVSRRAQSWYGTFASPSLPQGVHLRSGWEPLEFICEENNRDMENLPGDATLVGVSNVEAARRKGYLK
jgi:hypothetical protein